MNALILLVDDDEEFRSILSVGLQQLGYPIHGVENTYAAKKWLASNKPSLILLDLMMPDGNGLDFCRWIRAESTHKDIPILIVTGMKDEEEVQDAMDLGAVDFLRKPHSMQILAEKVRRLIAPIEPSDEQR